MVVDLQLIPMQSVHTTTDVVSSNLDQGEVYNITCLSDPLRITTSFLIRPYLFLPSIFPCF
jgi:hypothetical protein